jgi:hypothetical protein
MSIVEILGRKTNLFGGGYLRLANKLMIKWGINKLQTAGRPLIVYVHPREIDPAQPHLPLSLLRQFKCYVNLNSTLPKLKWLCKNYSMLTMLEMVENYIRSFYLKRRIIPVVHMQNNQTRSELLPEADHETFRRKLLLVEKAMAGFLGPANPAFSQTAKIIGIETGLPPTIKQQLSVTPKKQDSATSTVAANISPL